MTKEEIDIAFNKALDKRLQVILSKEYYKDSSKTRDVVLLHLLSITEWSEEFERLMRNRLIMGAFRYGLICRTFEQKKTQQKPSYDRIEAIRDKCLKYACFGNDELLVDIANLALLEFVEGEHPHKHFKATDDKDHVKIKV